MNKDIFRDEILWSWTKRFIVKNQWRLGDDFQYGDMISECWLVLDKVAKKYVDVSEKHFMSLYKTSLTNRFHDIARNNTSKQENAGFGVVGDDIGSLDSFAAERSIDDSAMREKCSMSSKVVAKAYNAVLSGELSQAFRKDLSRLNFNTRFDKILKLKSGTNSATKLREFLQAESTLCIK